MKILWLTWKDHAHPAAGGAEVVLWELSQRLVRDQHDVTWLTCGYKGADKQERIHGITIIRVGTNRYLHSLQALMHYVRKLRNQFDIVIEVVNTAPYFSVLFGKRAKRFLFYHQLAREIWFHETKPPLSHFGHYVLEPLATRLLASTGAPTVTVSESTKNDLARFGFSHQDMHIIPQGITLTAVKDLERQQKLQYPTILSLGALRAMKRTLHQIEAFELAKRELPKLQLKIAGLADGAYGAQVLDRIQNSPFARDIEYLGKVNHQQKIDLMRRAHLILQTSLKEGWGLTVSEAASQGTPAVAYDVDGLRDSVQHDKTGIITAPNPSALAEGIIELLGDSKTYQRMRHAGWEWTKQLTFDNTYQHFKTVLGVA